MRQRNHDVSAVHTIVSLQPAADDFSTRHRGQVVGSSYLPRSGNDNCLTIIMFDPRETPISPVPGC
jgi:hypothetical protein